MERALPSKGLQSPSIPVRTSSQNPAHPVTLPTAQELLARARASIPSGIPTPTVPQPSATLFTAQNFLRRARALLAAQEQQDPSSSLPSSRELSLPQPQSADGPYDAAAAKASVRIVRYYTRPTQRIMAGFEYFTLPAAVHRSPSNSPPTHRRDPSESFQPADEQPAPVAHNIFIQPSQTDLLSAGISPPRTPLLTPLVAFRVGSPSGEKPSYFPNFSRKRESTPSPAKDTEGERPTPTRMPGSFNEESGRSSELEAVSLYGRQSEIGVTTVDDDVPSLSDAASEGPPEALLDESGSSSSEEAAPYVDLEVGLPLLEDLPSPRMDSGHRTPDVVIDHVSPTADNLAIGRDRSGSGSLFTKASLELGTDSGRPDTPSVGEGDDEVVATARFIVSPSRTSSVCSHASHASRATQIHHPPTRHDSLERSTEAPPAFTVEDTVVKPGSGDSKSAKWIRQLLSHTTVDELSRTTHPILDTSDPAIKSLLRSPYEKLQDMPALITVGGSYGHDGHISTVDSHGDPADPEGKKDSEEYRRKVSEAFTKGILDMEGLLNEALKVAKQVADEKGEDITVTARERVQHAKSTTREASEARSSVADKLSVLANDGQHSRREPSEYSLVVTEAEKTAADGAHSITKPAKESLSRSASKRSALRNQSLLAEIFGRDRVEHLKGDKLKEGVAIPLKPLPAKSPIKDKVRPLVRESRSASSPPTWNDVSERPKFHLRASRRSSSRSSGHHEPKPTLGRKSSERKSVDEDEDDDGGSYFPRAWAAGPPLSSQPEEDEGTPDGHPGTSAINTPTKHRRDRGRMSPFRSFSLRDRHHVDIRISRRFNLSRTHRRKPISRDWGTFRKRYCATIACVTTALIGLVVGIYAGEVPAIQYQVVDEHHTVILGNVFLYLGIAITTFLFWSLPLLHGRKPYTLLAFSVFLPLQLPQALVVSTQRSPYVTSYMTALLLSRAASGLALGFANINLITTLLDLFGSSLQSRHPHQEAYHDHDVRHHGGGMGVWLSIWSWCYIGSIGVGFLFGALIINTLNPTWGFWITVVLTAAVLLLNVLIPEVRRSSYRRSVAEIRADDHPSHPTITRRVARGEVKMHLFATGPKWWWEEVRASLVLSQRMLAQRGLLIIVLYPGWVYAQIVMVVILLGALTSKYYHFRSAQVGACVSAIPLGALLAVPFEKASLFSRSRSRAQRTDSMTFQKRVTWSSHLVRRALFMITLPFADLAYTLTSGGPPTHFLWPTLFAGLIGFLSNLAIAECYGLIMETYDTSDLQPGMNGRRPRPQTTRDGERGARPDPRRTSFSCYPRVTAGLVLAQTSGFVIAAAATGVGGAVERRLGAELATGVIAVILLVLSVALTAVLWRYREVQVVPNASKMEVDRLGELGGGGDADESWSPVVIGNPSGRTRRMSTLEMGSMTRWTEIRRRNRLGGEGEGQGGGDSTPVEGLGGLPLRGRV